MLVDQRDAARLELDAVRRARKRLHNRVYELTRSRDLWRARARRQAGLAT